MQFDVRRGEGFSYCLRYSCYCRCQVGYNWFERNNEHAVRIVPLLSAVGRIANNTFVNHSRYVLLLDNGDDLLDERYYQSALVRYQVRSNISH